MEKRVVTAADWDVHPMPTAHAQFSFRRSFSQAQMELLRQGHVPQEMADQWFGYYEADKLYIHRSWTGFCIYIVTFTPGSDELSVLVNRDPEQSKCTDAQEDEAELNRLLAVWTNAGDHPDQPFSSEVHGALLPKLQRDHRATVLEKMQGCLYGGAAGDALGYPVEFMRLEQIRAKYGDEGIRFYALENGEASFSDDTQMTLFTLEGIYLWQKKRSQGAKDARLKNSLFDAYRDWAFTQEQGGSSKARHRPRTRLYQLPAMHRRMGPGFTCVRALWSKQVGSMAHPLNDSKGNGGVMRVAPIGFVFPREAHAMEEVMRMGAESAAITHGHPLGYISAAMMAGLINECVYGESATLRSAVELALHMTMKLFSPVQEARELEALVNAAMKLAGEEGDPVAQIATMGNSVCAESTVAIAVYCALRHEDCFERAIRTAVNFDGDSDTVAAVTGNILGAWKGIACIDPRWIAPLHMERYLEALAEYGLCELIP